MRLGKGPVPVVQKDRGRQRRGCKESSSQSGKGSRLKSEPSAMASLSSGHRESFVYVHRPQRGLPVCVSPPFGGLLKATAFGRGRLLTEDTHGFASPAEKL